MAVELVADDGDRNHIGLGVKGIPNQLGDTSNRLGRAGKAIELIRIDLDWEALNHRGVPAASCDAFLAPAGWTVRPDLLFLKPPLPAGQVLTPTVEGIRTSPSTPIAPTRARSGRG